MTSDRAITCVHIIAGLDVGGAERALNRFVKQSSRSGGLNNIVVSLTTKGVLGKEIEGLGVSVYSCDVSGVLGFISSIFKIYAIAKKHRADVLHGWMYHGCLMAGIVGVVIRSKIVWGIRTTSLKYGVSKGTRALSRLLALLSGLIPDRIICVAHSAMRSHMEMGYSKSKMEVVSNGFDCDEFQFSVESRRKIRERLGISDEVKVVGVVGRYNPDKDYENFICAFSILLERERNVICLLIGKDVSEENVNLMGLIDREGIRSSCILAGVQSAVSEFYSAMDVFCLSSVSEAFPNVVAEAMLSGLPCVVTNVGDAGSLVGGVGLVVPPKSPTALASALYQYVAMAPEGRASVGESARRRIIDEYSIHRVEERYIGIYGALLARQAP